MNCARMVTVLGALALAFVIVTKQSSAPKTENLTTAPAPELSKRTRAPVITNSSPTIKKAATQRTPLTRLDSQIDSIENQLKNNDSLARLKADHLPPEERAKTVAMLRQLIELRSQELDLRMNRIQNELAKRQAR